MLLIIDGNTAQRSSLALSFSYMGILARHIRPAAAASEISPLYRAVLVRNPEALPDCTDFIKRLRLYAADIPFFALSDSVLPTLRELFLAIFPVSITAFELAIGIIKASKLSGLLPIGEYKLSGIDASVNLPYVEYFFTKIKLTAKESMILRFLIRAHPAPASIGQILKYVFSPSKIPEPSAVRTHISSINKKFSGELGKRLICSPECEGYIIMTPEVSVKKSPFFVE